jgi:uncharacterized protein
VAAKPVTLMRRTAHVLGGCVEPIDVSPSVADRGRSPSVPISSPVLAAHDAAQQAADRGSVLRSVPVRLLIMFVGLLGVDVLCQLVPGLLHPASKGPRPAVLAIGSAIGTMVAMIAAYRLLVRWIETRLAQELGRKGAILGCVTGALCGVGLFVTVELLLVWKGVAHIGAYTGTAYLFRALTFALATGVAEEIVFRGVVFRIMEEGFGTLVALLFSAALFGALHGFNPGASLVSSAAIAIEAGVLLAAAYTATRSLWLPIGLHFGWNFAEGGLFGAAVSGNTVHGLVSSTPSGDPLWSGGAFGPEASIVAVGVCLTAAIVFLSMTVRRGYWEPLRFRMRMPRTRTADLGAAR